MWHANRIDLLLCVGEPQVCTCRVLVQRRLKSNAESSRALLAVKTLPASEFINMNGVGADTYSKDDIPASHHSPRLATVQNDTGVSSSFVSGVSGMLHLNETATPQHRKSAALPWLPRPSTRFPRLILERCFRLGLSVASKGSFPPSHHLFGSLALLYLLSHCPWYRYFVLQLSVSQRLHAACHRGPDVFLP